MLYYECGIHIDIQCQDGAIKLNDTIGMLLLGCAISRVSSLKHYKKNKQICPLANAIPYVFR